MQMGGSSCNIILAHNFYRIQVPLACAWGVVVGLLEKNCIFLMQLNSLVLATGKT